MNNILLALEFPQDVKKKPQLNQMLIPVFMFAVYQETATVTIKSFKFLDVLCGIFGAMFKQNKQTHKGQIQTKRASSLLILKRN